MSKSAFFKSINIQPGISFILLGISIITLLICGCNNDRDKDSFVKIFDGETLEGWEGDSTYWRAENGKLIGEITPSTLLENNTFIIWEGGEPGNYELKAEFRISSNGNSGINYRSIKLDSLQFALKGYQADIDGQNSYTGQSYEERGRTTLAYRGEEVRVNTPNNPSESLMSNVNNNAWLLRDVTGSLGKPDSLANLIEKEDWNEIHLVLDNNRMKHYVNGVLMSDVTDNDTVNRKADGKLGLQVHVGPPMKVEYRNLRLKEL